MVPTWIATSACGWVSAAETTEELMLLLDTHRTHASPGQLHTVTIKGQLVISLSAATSSPAFGVTPAMSPPRWTGEPTHRCPRCGRIVGPLHMRTEHLNVGREPTRAHHDGL
jgi:hypothetical protein